jgi:uncharacterized membrane protein YcaP (DUF421 family)
LAVDSKALRFAPYALRFIWHMFSCVVDIKQLTMQILNEIFGTGKDLNVLQMTVRSVVVFIIALILIRISGRRSFGLHSPLDNIIAIVLGAVLSRAIVGASGFLPVIASCTALVLIHRLFAYGMVHHPVFSRLVSGEKILLFKDGDFLKKDMDKALICQEEILQEVRKSALTENLDQIGKIYMERNGEVSSVKKA